MCHFLYHCQIKSHGLSLRASRMLHNPTKEPADIQRVSSFFHAEVPFEVPFLL